MRAVTRFAPSPTGYLHLGHAYAAFVAQAAAAGGRFLVRIEDLDPTRARLDYETAIFEDLAWLGLSWEDPVMRQSTRGDAYAAALATLRAAELVYPCFCTRKDIADEIARAGEAPQGPDGPLYPGLCRTRPRSDREARIADGQSFAWRLDSKAASRHAGPLSFREHGELRAVQATAAGDVVLARKDAPAAYHLAVVVDDAAQGVTCVTRGEDLLPAVHVQRVLQAVLGLPAPDYAHHRLICDADGKRLAKRDAARSLRALRADGVTPAQIRSQLGLA